MIDRIRQLAQDALNDVDKFEPGIRETPAPGEREDPVAIAHGLERFFASVPVKAYPGEHLFGRLRMDKCGYPGDFYRATGTRSKGAYWSRLCWVAPTNVFYWGWTHIVLDYGFLLTHGLRGCIEMIDAQPQPNRQHEAMRIVLHALGDLSSRYAQICTDSALAAILRRVPMQPAETFREAVQAVWFLFQLCPDSLGRIDQYLLPYYRRGLADGTLSRDDAAELLEELFVKVFETQMDNKALPISGHNHLVVGGYLPDGTDGFNELSRLVLECIAELPTFRPQASFRYTKFTTDETMRYITDLNARCQWIVFVNDEPRIPGMVAAGIDYADAVNYTVVGCNEWSLPCGARIDLAHVNLMHAVTHMLYDDPRFAHAQTFDEVFDCFRRALETDMRAIAAEYAHYADATAADINVLTSAMMPCCIRSGAPISGRGAKYYGVTMSFNSISNAADSLSVIRQLVFDTGKYTLTQLRAALRDNFVGHDALRQEILHHGRFFGNNDDYVDGIAQKIVDAIDEIRSRIRTDRMNVLIAGSFVGATHPNIVFGKVTPATPDGRRAGDAFTMGITQSDGKDTHGLPALLSSIAKLDYSKFCGCVVSNIKLDKSMASTAEKRAKLAQLYHVFLRRGGMQLQINYLSQQELLDAQAHPEQHQNLVVRVTGYSGYFTRFDKDLQDDIIRRTVEKDL